MSLNFDKYAQDGNQFLKTLANDLGYPDERDYVSFVLRSILHTLRDRITISESLDLLAQLPMFLKAVYVENWKYKDKPDRIRTLEEFIEKVNQNHHKYYETDFYKYVIDEKMISIVLSSIKKYVSEGEFEDIISQLPKELKPLIKIPVTKFFG